MPGVLTQAVGRQDVLIRRGVSARWGVLWEQDDGSGFQPVDLLTWSGTLRVSSPHGDVWLEQPVELTSDGLAIADLAASTTSSDVWAGRPRGTWTITATSPDGHVERLGEGTIRIED
ncbi:hypothetical protein [Pseudoclavibacter sp. 13-3]|uniref:hypothetical protein n=1 Tax=Pseudoclavibacter sp. 13-3 TaxID=2901228 RepID=UPI001E5003D7|nr:hypothetical protein [Pseudoclavibacter sp. 13-3]MCD7100440.1 hypothetical protein [Pseudoclavibacter sp. 13-3]